MDVLHRRELTKVLEEFGYYRVATTTNCGAIEKESFFNREGVLITIDYIYVKSALNMEE